MVIGILIGNILLAQNLITNQNYINNLDVVKARKISISNVMSSNNIPVIIKTNLGTNEAIAQDVFLKDLRLKDVFIDRKNNKLLNEVFNVYKALPSDNAAGTNNNMYRVELYNYPYNLSVIGMVDVNTKTVTNFIINKSTAPEIPEHLKNLAINIAAASPDVKQQLGDSNTTTQAIMASTKTALNRSKCQRTMHLCVAPTFVKGSKALWCIVDITDMRIVGTRWTSVGVQDSISISERPLQNQVINDCYCIKTNTINKANWQMDYMLTSSDGLKVANVKYKNKTILKSAKLVDWHVSYSNTDGFGYSDGVGCPMYSLSAVVAWDAPVIADLIVNNAIVGFTLEQKFQSEGWPRACNYNYVQRYEFYTDGRFRTTTASIGRGCGTDGTYRPVFRLAFEGKNSFAQYDNNSYTTWQKEKWHLQTELTSYASQGYLFKINGEQNYYVEPNRGQFNDNSRGDNAYTYITKYKPEEGEQDMLTIGPCCNNNYEQGPEKFMENENVNNTEIVLWYVPQMKNDGRPGKEYCWAEASIKNGVYTTTTYPCFVGPMFVPVNN
jgi:hypothetical protein